MKSRNWLGCHRRMYEWYGGVPHVTVPDCLKTGVVKCHLYDPDLNEDYAYLAAHFSTAIVPARVRRPRDKAIAEGLVKILSRYFRFRFRRSRFTSIAEINRALMVCVERINDQTHRRFGVSRRERFEKVEKAALKALPSVEYDGGEWKTAKLHPDCYVSVDGDYYSAPHIHRGKSLRIKLTEHHVEIFLNLERLAIHPRCRQKMGMRIKILAHFPANSVAFYGATPQKLLSQSRFIHPDLNMLFLELFNADVYAHIRRAMGLVSACTKEISRSGHALANEHIATAIATMRRYNRIRTPYFQELLKQAGKQSMNPQPMLLIGETGVGKTFIAQAVGLHACANGKSVLYMSITALQENLAIARSSGTYLRYRAKLAKFDLIIFDEMGMRKFTATEAQDLCEIIEERSIDKSVAFTSQLPVAHWNEVISDTVIFDAIRDRLEHSALTVNITGPTYRGVKARKLASKKKVA